MENQRDGLLKSSVFQTSADQDYSDSKSVIAFAGRGELGLPDRDYYTKTDKKSLEIRSKYLQHLRDVFELLGDQPKQAMKEAHQVLSLETSLAKSMLTRVELRDPQKLFHKQTSAKFKALVPALDWNPYFEALGLQSVQVINVTEPKYFQTLQRLLVQRPIAEWRTLLRWNLIREFSPYLSSRFVNADFEFYSKLLHGTRQILPRWRRCEKWIDQDLGEALGEVFVTKTFSPETKSKTILMTKEIEDAMTRELQTLSWMSEATRRQAMEKMKTLVNKIGYPDTWRDYSKLAIAPDDFSGNVMRAAAFEHHRELNKIGKPLDRSEWEMTPPTVNAYYSAQMNDINFPAGVLQPPLFDSKMDEAPNYGNTGATIGHELTHGFDDEGRQFDAQGNLRDWWTKQDASEFQKRAKCVSDQYSRYVAIDDLHVNGSLTNGEDIADLGGTMLALQAWKHATEGQKLKTIDGLEPDQRFFIGMAQWACGDARPETRRNWAITNPHSPLEDRINGVVSNMPEFAKAFSCVKGNAMVRDVICRIW